MKQVSWDFSNNETAVLFHHEPVKQIPTRSAIRRSPDRTDSVANSPQSSTSNSQKLRQHIHAECRDQNKIMMELEHSTRRSELLAKKVFHNGVDRNYLSERHRFECNGIRIIDPIDFYFCNNVGGWKAYCRFTSSLNHSAADLPDYHELHDQCIQAGDELLVVLIMESNVDETTDHSKAVSRLAQYLTSGDLENTRDFRFAVYLPHREVRRGGRVPRVLRELFHILRATRSRVNIGGTFTKRERVFATIREREQDECLEEINMKASLKTGVLVAEEELDEEEYVSETTPIAIQASRR